MVASTQVLTREPISGKRVEDYKYSGMQVLVPDSTREPLNLTLIQGGLSLPHNLEGHSTVRDSPQSVRVPVVSKLGKSLMPCKPSKARKLLKDGKAEKCWSNLGIFYIQLIFDIKSEPNEGQQVCLGLDPGFTYDGKAVVSKKQVLLTGMTELPKGIAWKMEQRRRQRRFRRYRKCRRRPCRFDNRMRKDGWIAPSQRAKVKFRLKIVQELQRLYPITEFAVEDVRFNHYRKRWGEYFSTVEIGKTHLYDELKKTGHLHLFEGVETSALRERYGLKKTPDKRKQCLEAHAVDALAISAEVVKLEDFTVFSFFVWKEYQFPRRQLHRFQFLKGSIRRRYGGSDSLGFKKGDVVLFKGTLARVGGNRNGFLSLHKFDLDNKRFTQKVNANEVRKLFNQRVIYAPIPPRTEAVGFLGGFR